MTRFLGTPRVAAAFYIACSLTVLGWAGGEVHWWLALPALCFISTVRKAVKDVRRYDQWVGAWQAMGNPSGIVAPKPKVRRRKTTRPWIGITVASLSLTLISLLIISPQTDAASRHDLTLLWWGIACYLLCKIAVTLRRKARQNRAGTASAGGGKSSGAVDVVEWMLPPASSSPSRAEAMRNVPDYCARLMAPQ
jgi:hypothetical protein